jgi:ADP-dependent NAD(P)H-hydrate dehydratase / NAD(P)H-hydrate epimerase
MQGAWTVEQIRAAERKALAGTPAGELMQRAATAVAVATARLLKDRSGGVYGRRVAILVGGGNNGGDALYAGAWLASAGAQVSAVLLVPDRTHPDVLDEFTFAGGKIVEVLPWAEVVIDGMLGLGGRPGLQDRSARLAELVHDAEIPVVSIDIPSGLDIDTGVVDTGSPGSAMRATVTVTFGGLKPGLLVGQGPEYAGEVQVVDLGFDLEPPSLHVLEGKDVAAALRRPGRLDDKYTRGVLGIVAGSPQYSGAAVLCTGAALRGGCGMIRYAGTAPDIVRERWPEVVVHENVASAGRVQAWVIGPGIGTDDAASEALARVLYTDVPVLVDADGITLLGSDWFSGATRERSQPTILTPHDREFERLFGEIGTDRLGAARRAAAESGAVVLLKGSATVVATPDGTAYVNPTGTPWLATAGSGDVLSGLIGAILASGVEAPMAAAAGAYLHGVAGRLAAEGGPPSAVDVLESLRTVMGVVAQPVAAASDADGLTD